jgi:hypothetical protein
MMTHVETSYMMTFVRKLMEIYLRSYGYGYPMIVAFNKGKDLKLDIKNPSIIDSRTSAFRDGKLITEERERPFGPEDVFMQTIMLRLKSEEDEKVIAELFKTVGQKYSPDACAYMQSCLYGEYDDPSLISEDDMNIDPEVLHVLNISYFTREDPVPRICVIPFINKGEVQDNEIPDDEEGERKLKYTVLMVGCGWFKPYYKVNPIIQNPYVLPSDR